MPNGGIRGCDTCIHNESGLCKVRNERIFIYPHWMTCDNWNSYNLNPDGVIFSVVGEVKNGGISYGKIPYYKGMRVDTIQNGSDDTIVIWRGKDGSEMKFKDVDEYLEFYENERIKKKSFILGAIIGDIIGSVFEHHNNKSTDFHLFCENTEFTDDSVLTFATMGSILNGIDYATAYQSYGRKFPHRGYGGYFRSWIRSDHPEPYNSYGNGSAMRVSPVGWAYDSLEEVLLQAKRSAEVTHNHREGIKGAQATAAAVFLARTGLTKADIKKYIQATYGYDLERRLDDIRPVYKFNETCQETVPEAIIAFLESEDYESAIRLAISIGGDSDTVACITGGIAEAFYRETPEWIVDNAMRILPADVIKLIEKFSLKYRNFQSK